MSDMVWFSEDPLPLPSSLSKPPAHGYAKPKDRLNVPPVAPYTLWYLSIIKPHTDSHETHGPVKKFAHLLPKIEAIVSNSPNAIDKLDELKEMEDIWGERSQNEEFFRSGFERFVVEGQRASFTVLEVVREVNREVFENLPAPVYTVISSGPLTHALVPKKVPKSSKFEAGMPHGYARETRLLASYVEREAAHEKARDVLTDLVRDDQDAKCTEKWDKGSKGGGLLMAMSPRAMWEVKVVYEDDALKRAMDDSVMSGEKLGWR